MTEWLASRGHQVRVITAPPYYPRWRIEAGHSGWVYRCEEGDAVRVYRCPLWVPSRPSGLKRLVHLASFAISSLPVILWQGLTWRPDIIWVVEPTVLNLPAVRLAGYLGKSTTWLHVQDFEVDAAFDLKIFPAGHWIRGLVHSCERWLMRRFDYVSTISPPMMERLRTKGVETPQCVLFPNWVDTEAIYPVDGPSPMRKELGIPDDTVVALYSGNMGEKQGLEVLIKAAHCLVDCPRIQFLFCGDGAAQVLLMTQAATLPNVRFLPLQSPERLNHLLNLANIHLLPQRPDAADLVMPSKLTGMFASGRPVVATAHPNTYVATVVRGCGLVVSPGNAAALAKAVGYLAENPKQCREFGNAGRTFAMTHWQREKILEQFEKALADGS